MAGYRGSFKLSPLYTGTCNSRKWLGMDCGSQFDILAKLIIETDCYYIKDVENLTERVINISRFLCPGCGGDCRLNKDSCIIQRPA